MRGRRASASLTEETMEQPKAGGSRGQQEPMPETSQGPSQACPCKRQFGKSPATSRVRFGVPALSPVSSVSLFDHDGRSNEAQHSTVERRQLVHRHHHFELYPSAWHFEAEWRQWTLRPDVSDQAALLTWDNVNVVLAMGFDRSCDHRRPPEVIFALSLEIMQSLIRLFLGFHENNIKVGLAFLKNNTKANSLSPSRRSQGYERTLFTVPSGCRLTGLLWPSPLHRKRLEVFCSK
jgi:hypothetical protein